METAVLAAVTAGWETAAARPKGYEQLLLVAAAAIAMGPSARQAQGPARAGCAPVDGKRVALDDLLWTTDAAAAPTSSQPPPQPDGAAIDDTPTSPDIWAADPAALSRLETQGAGASRPGL